MAIRILLADDHEIVRSGLCHIMEGRPDIEIVGEAKSGRQAVEMARDTRLDIIIMDVTMPDLNGIDATHQIRRDNPQIRVIALSMHHKRQFILDMFSAGAKGYVLKSDIGKQLLHAIDVVQKGDVYLSPSITGLIIDSLIHNSSRPISEARNTILSSRERETLQLIAEGKSTKQIASLLHISIKTVESTRRRISIKLGITSVAEMTKYAIAEGLTLLDQ
jgi:two-component system, NarL family, response regulator NreC